MSQQNQSSGLPIGALIITFAIGIAIIVGVAAFLSNGEQTEPADDAVVDTGSAVVGVESQSDGVNLLEDPRPLDDFTMVNDEGQEVSLSDFRGEYVLVYFGYTYCPDFCPTTFTDLRLVMRGLGDVAGDLNVVLISVDPDRDTLEILNRYVNRFNPDFIGLTGTVETIDAVVDDFGAFYQIDRTDDSPYYRVDHTASKFLIDPDGNLVLTYAYGIDVDVLANDLRNRLTTS